MPITITVGGITITIGGGSTTPTDPGTAPTTPTGPGGTMEPVPPAQPSAGAEMLSTTQLMRGHVVRMGDDTEWIVSRIRPSRNGSRMVTLRSGRSTQRITIRASDVGVKVWMVRLS